MVKNLSADLGYLNSIPSSEKSHGRENGMLSSILAWKIPWIEEPGGLQSSGLQRIGHD